MATQAPYPQIDRRLWTCPECGKTPVRKSLKGPAPMFCSKECATKCERRKISDGRAVIDLLKAWRVCRNNKGDSRLGGAIFSEICTVVDTMIERDRTAGRTTARLLGYVSRILGGGFYNHDYQTHSADCRRAHPERDTTTHAEILEGLRSIDERLGDQLTNMEANALRFAIEKYS